MRSVWLSAIDCVYDGITILLYAFPHMLTDLEAGMLIKFNFESRSSGLGFRPCFVLSYVWVAAAFLLLELCCFDNGRRLLRCNNITSTGVDTR